MKITVGQAVIKYLKCQYVEFNGDEKPFSQDVSEYSAMEMLPELVKLCWQILISDIISQEMNRLQCI